MASAREYMRNWMRWQRGRQGTGYDKMGDFVCESPIFETTRIKLFRSDVSMHSVTRVQGGSRYVLSLGWVLK
jgi:hypothetical protein